MAITSTMPPANNNYFISNENLTRISPLITVSEISSYLPIKIKQKKIFFNK